MIHKNDRFYINNWFNEPIEPNDKVEFEMPSFCSGIYEATIYFDNDGEPYIDNANNYIDGCRDYHLIKRQLKLFIWRNIRRDYTPGIGFAMAYDVEEAREKIKEQSDDWEWSVYKYELIPDPEVYTVPYGTWISGGG